jgi:hypothetical protein
LKIRELLLAAGITNQIYQGQSAFWIVHHDAVECVYDLAFEFWHRAKAVGLAVDVSIALGYAAQLLCGNPEAHVLVNSPWLWAGDDRGHFRDRPPDLEPWQWSDVCGTTSAEVRPAIVHLPHRKAASRFSDGTQ